MDETFEGRPIHILRGPATTTETEKLVLSELDRYQRRFLSRFGCGACEQPMDRPGCGAYMGGACTERTRIVRRWNCLKLYKPRPSRRGARD